MPSVSQDEDFASLACAALGLDRLDLQPAHEIVDGTLTLTVSDCGTRLEARYVAVDPFPPSTFWPEDGSKGKLSSPPEAGGIPVRVTSSGVEEVTDGMAGATHSYHPPAGSEPSAWRRHLRGFEAWRGGEAYGFVSEIYSVQRKAGRVSPIAVEATWGALDLETATELSRPSVEAHSSLPIP